MSTIANCKVGQTLIVEFEKECFIGECVFINPNRTRIACEKVKNLETDERFDGRQNYYLNAVKSIKIVDGDESSSNSISHEAVDNSSSVASTAPADEQKFTSFTCYEIDRMCTMAEEAIYIYQTDSTYHDAIKDIRSQSAITLILEGCEMGRNSKTKIVTIGTSYKIYIFDIVSLGRIFKELKEVLESNRPRKIIHNSNRVLDHLKYAQDVQVKKVFDTYVAHVMVSKSRAFLSLNECVERYMRFPSKFFLSEKEIDWFSRPFDKERRIITGRRSAILFKLYEHFLHEEMLGHFYSECENFASFHCNNSDWVDVAMKYSNNEKDDARNSIRTNGFDEILMKNI